VLTRRWLGEQSVLLAAREPLELGDASERAPYHTKLTVGLLEPGVVDRRHQSERPESAVRRAPPRVSSPFDSDAD